MHSQGNVAPAGVLHLEVIRADPFRAPPPPRRLREVVFEGLPHLGLPEEVRSWRRANLPHLLRGARRVAMARWLGIAHCYGELRLKVQRADGLEVDYGLASMRVVTDTGVGFIVDAFQNLTELENMKFHALGTGSTAEAAGDTALVTELTTEYNPNNTRATGTTTESAANIYRTVGTNTVDSAPGAAIREHGILSQAGTGGGVLLDRSVFAAITLAANDGIQSTYDFTITSGS